MSHLASTPPEVAVQRVLARGSGTGWGAFAWVEGGEALWKRIDKAFNTDLIKVRDDLKAIVEKEERSSTTSAQRSAYDSIRTFITTWEERGKVYFAANPAQGQKLSAAELATVIEGKVELGRASVTAATQMKAESEEEGDLVDDESLEETPDLINAEKPESALEDDSGTASPAVIHMPSSASGSGPGSEGVSSGLTPPVVEVETEPVGAITTDIATATAKKPSQKKKKQASGPKPKTKAEIQEEARKVNAEKKRQAELKAAAVASFAKLLRDRSDALIASEKINDFKFRQTWATDLEAVMKKADQQVRGGKAVPAALRIAYDTWTAVLLAQRDANRLARRGNVAEWQMWTGLNDYRVVDGLPGAQFTPATRVPDPVEGPVAADGTPPAHVPVEAPDPLSIHVTYDLKSVRSPVGAVNGAPIPALVSDVLSVSTLGWRVHGTLESPPGGPYPHVYWGGSDLGLGSGRYPQWNGIGAGWLPGPQGPSAKAKVQDVLDDFVADRVVPRVEGFKQSFTYTEYDWPAFEAFAPADPVVAEVEAEEGVVAS